MKAEPAAESLNRDLAPLCPRDNHIMRFEPHGVHWRAEGRRSMGEATRAYATQQFEYDDLKESLPSYRCPACSVRYTPAQGYFTVVEVPEQPYFVDEPGANTLACPVHKSWLYRRERNDRNGYEWACGSDNCAYVHTDVPGDWLRHESP